eukprot:Em0007g346a
MNQSAIKVDIAFTVINVVSVLVCLLTTILVFHLKLHRSFVYRLALCQVLSALLFAAVESLQIIFVNYRTNPEVYGRVCTAIGFFGMYTRWVKLLFTMWVTFHLVCFAVLRKSLEKLEVLYVVTSLLVPVVIVAVPLMTNTYRLSTFHSYCYIYSDNQQIESAERLALWDVPAMVILMAVFIAMLVVMKRVANHLCRRQSYESITSFGGGEVFWRVFKQLLPLTAFPIIFFIFILPALIFHIYAAKNSQSNRDGALIIPAVIFISLWSLASGVTLMIHLLCARRYVRKMNPEQSQTDTPIELHQ